MPKVDHQKNIIEVSGVSFAYGRHEVLRDVTLAVHQGDYLGIVGPNGAGKTTLLKIMLGLLTPASGNVKLFGTDLKNFRDYHRIGYVPQKATNFDVNFPATVYEVVAMGRYSRRGPWRWLTAADREIINQSLRQVGLANRQDALIGDLSGGQEQRVFIARALAGQPEIMFLDEPTTGIDPQSRDDFYKLLRELNQNLDLTLVLVSHDIDRITKEVMHIACLDHRLVCHNSPEEFLRESESLHIFGQDVKIIAHHHDN
jgi:zinc transport system ATP-binding protein